MAAFRFIGGISFLRTKVARRVFLLFLVCSVVPLVAMAWLSFSQVSNQLIDNADRRLHTACKSASAALYDRLQVVETDLRDIVATIKGRPTLDLEGVVEPRKERIDLRFESIAVIGADEEVVALHGRPFDRPSLDTTQMAHLAKGLALLLFVPAADQTAAVYLAIREDLSGARAALVLAQIAQQHLWGSDTFHAPGTEVVVLNEVGDPLFSSLRERFPFDEVERARASTESSGRFEWCGEVDRHIASFRTLFMRPRYLTNLTVVQCQPLGEVLSPVSRFRTIFALTLVLSFLVIAMVSLSQIRRSMVPIDQLHQATQRISGGRFTERVAIQSRDEFQDLGEAFNEMASDLEEHVQALGTINQIGMALSAEKDTDRLVHIILDAAQRLIHCEGCALYVVVDDRLERKRSNINALEVPLNLLGPGDLALDAAIDPANASSLAARAVNLGRVNTGRLCNEVDEHPETQLAADRGLKPIEIMSVPMKNHEDEINGVVQFITVAKSAGPNQREFTDEQHDLALTVASQAAVALTKNYLVDGFRGLFEGLIELIARAIDEKSPYTGDHCRRVPELTMMLAEAACATTRGPFADFDLSREEFYELKIAALLHDCGKVCTPVHVVDKATKLETIHDRIELVELRLEIARRDEELAELRRVLESQEGETPGDSATRERDAGLQELREARDFLRTCNTGSEFMGPEDQRRLVEIREKWLWTDIDGKRRSIMTDDEFKNISIQRGTLNGEERDIINRHITSTIEMLESLPYPRSLRNVPILAGSHHERMDGKGYPRGLSRDEIPVGGRMIGVVDVFEALTAGNRPYKKAKTLSEALHIMGKMTQGGHLDPDLFNLLISEGVYLRYARQHMDPDQIDEVHLASIPGYVDPRKQPAPSLVNS